MAKKTHEQYVAEVAIKNPNIEVVEKYIDAKTKILHRCQKHNIVWMASPDSILHGCGCEMCGREKIRNKLLKTHDQYVDDVANNNPNVEVVGVYIDNRTPILHRCKKHNVLWESRPYNVLMGKGCPVCCGEKIGDALRNDTEWYIRNLDNMQSTFMPIEKYQGYYIPILHKCTIDGYEGLAKPINVLRGFGCPKCTGYNGENEIAKWLDDHNIQYQPQYRFDDCKDRKKLPFDFYLTELNKLIEFDGRQHYEPVDFAGKGNEWAIEQLQVTQQHDEIKNRYCQQNDIPLLRIPYFNDISEELEKFLFI